MDIPGLRDDAFPAPSKHATGTVGGVATEASVTSFADKLLITVSQDGRFAQWTQVPLSAPSPASVDMAMPGPGPASAVGGGGGVGGPAAHLTPRTLLGGGGEDRETLGQLYAAQIASHVALRDPADRRTLVLGLGLRRFDAAPDVFFDVLELVQKVL